MESQKVRIINEKGEARLVMPHIARDKKIMKSYGYRIQDLKEKEAEAYAKTAINEIVVGLKDKEPLDLLAVAQTTEKSEKEVRAEYEAIFGKKAGNKKLETILKEIKEKK